VYLPNINNTFSGVNTFPTPTPNSLEPASTKYVKDKFNSFFSRDNAFTGTSTFTKATPTTSDIATTKYMTTSFLNNLTLGANVKCQTIVSSGTTLANTSATRTIINGKISSLLSGNNALDNQTFVTQASTDNSTKIATTEYTETITFSSLLTGTNNWTLDQNFLTQTTGSSNTRMATTQFVEAMTYSMNTNTITGIHTVPTAATNLTGQQIANLDYTIANKPNYNSFLNISNTWSGIVTFPTAVTGTSSRVVANTEFVRNVFNIDLLDLNTWTNTITLPAVVGTTNNSTRGATTACVPSYLSVSMPSMTSAPTIKFMGTCLTPSPSGSFSVDARVANCNYVGTTVASSFENAGNVGITFTGVQRCPTRLTASTLLANSAYVAGKVVQYFSPSTLSTFKSTSHTWSANNFFTYALSTLDNSTLGATCSYVSQNLSQSKNYLGAITFNSQPVVQLTSYPPSIGQIGYTDTYNATKTGLTVGFNTLIDFGTIGIGNYIFTVKEIVTCSGTTSALNAFNFFWGTSTTAAELNFGDFTGGGMYSLAPNMVAWGLRMGAGVTTFHRMFSVAFVNSSTLVHSVRATGTLTPITSVQSIVSITRIA
jgi:hypothetical protein